jgi:hypothetical protein
MPIPGENTMKKITKEKRNQLILVIMVTLIGLAGIWFGLINFQREYLEQLAVRKDKARKALQDQDRKIKAANQIESELGDDSRKLGALEENMVQGDSLTWMRKQIRDFARTKAYNVEIDPGSSPPEIKSMDLLPGFPYQQATLTISGKALYYEFAQFVTDFENRFPHYQLRNFMLQSIAQNPGEKDQPSDPLRLSFSIQVVCLIKPNQS